MFYQDLQYSLDGLCILFDSSCEDQNIIQVHHYYPFGNEVPEDIFYYHLEGGQAVGHSKEHY